MSRSPSPAAETPERKTVLIRFPEELHRMVSEHARTMSESLGGARISFNAAALSLMHSGLKRR